MNYRSVATTHAVSATLGGLLLLGPVGWLLGLLALDSPQTEVIGRFAGAMLVALGVTLIGARDTLDPATRRTVVAGNGATDALMCGYFAWATSSGLLSPFGWGLAVLFAANAGSWAVVWAQPDERA